jgi:hypothetical protein
LAVPGLIAKLLDADVVTKDNGDLAFTETFGKHVYTFASGSPDKIGNLSGWREMLDGFNPALSNLSTEEVAAVSILLDYQLNRMLAPAKDR